jgi:hypothetical protein
MQPFHELWHLHRQTWVASWQGACFIHATHLMSTTTSLWTRFQKFFVRYPQLGFSIDISRMAFEESLFDSMAPSIDKAFAQMKDLEAGAIANPDEGRMVGHYWLRTPELAPDGHQEQRSTKRWTPP